MRKMLNLLAVLVLVCSCIGIGFLLNIQSEAQKAMDMPNLRSHTQDKVNEQNQMVRAVSNLKYGEHERQALDIYMPPDANSAPVLFFVHGGGWSEGHREMYGSVGYFYAKKGFVTVVVDHRLSPAVAHPAHIEDVAKALAWTKDNISEYGGSANRIWLMGHSSGAHLVSLLVTNQRYLVKEKLSRYGISGVVAISGIYTLGSNISIAGFGHVFPKDSDRHEASPTSHIVGDASGTPKFLILYAENDIITLAGQAKTFDKALRLSGVQSRLHKVSKQDHTTILLDCLTQSQTSKVVLDFLK